MSLGDHRHQCLPPVPEASCGYVDLSGTWRNLAAPAPQMGRGTRPATAPCCTSCVGLRADSVPRDTLPEWSKGVDSSSTSASCVGSNPTGVTVSAVGPQISGAAPTFAAGRLLHLLCGPCFKAPALQNSRRSPCP